MGQGSGCFRAWQDYSGRGSGGGAGSASSPDAGEQAVGAGAVEARRDDEHLTNANARVDESPRDVAYAAIDPMHTTRLGNTDR